MSPISWCKDAILRGYMQQSAFPATKVKARIPILPVNFKNAPPANSIYKK